LIKDSNVKIFIIAQANFRYPPLEIKILHMLKANTRKNFSYYYKIVRSSYLIKNISKVYTGDIISKVIGVLAAILLIRGLAIEDYAAYTAFYGILSLIPGLIGGGVNLALVRFSTEYISKTKRRPFELYFISLIFQIVLYVLFGIILFSLSDKLTKLLFGHKPFVLALRYGLIAGLGYLITQAGRVIYQAEERFGYYVKTLWFRQSFIFIFVSVLFLLRQLNFYRIAQAVIVIELFVASIITFHVFRGFHFKHTISFFNSNLDIIKNFISSTGWLIAYFFMLISFQRLDIFMLSHFSPAEELANYGVAFRYYSLSLLLLGSIHVVLLPMFSKVDMQDPAKQRQFARKWIKAMGWLIIPIVIFDFFGKSFFLGINGIQYERAFYMFIIFSIGIWLSLMFSPLVNILMSRKAFKFLFALAIGALCLNFTGNYLLIPLWGGFGAAVVTVMSHGLINIIAGIMVFSSEH